MLKGYSGKNTVKTTDNRKYPDKKFSEKPIKIYFYL